MHALADRRHALLAYLALLSAGGLILELSLVRVLSALYVYSFVYIVVAVAILGIGLGAAAASLFPNLRRPSRLPGWALGAATSAVALTAATLHGAGVGAGEITIALAVVPYGFIGLALATAFSAYSSASSRLYWADLSGAGVGTVAAVLLLNALGGPGGMLAGALLLAFAAPALTPRSAAYWLTAAGVAVAVGAAIISGWLELDYQETRLLKPIHEQLQTGAHVEATRWDAFARTDLVKRRDQGLAYIYVDGGAGSLVPDPQRPEVWRRDIGSYPFIAESPRSAVLIGTGGGLDIVQADAAGVEEIVAIEMNAATLELVAAAFGDERGPYGAAESVLVDEGRSALRRSGRTFDIVFLSQVVAQAAEARAYALTENLVHTVEAFDDYLDHLTPGGVIAVKLYDELTLTRALVTALTALSKRGMSDSEAAAHVMALLDTSASPPIPLLAVFDTPMTRDDAVRRARVAEDQGLALLFVPGLIAPPPLAGLVEGTASIRDVVIASAGVDMRPATDDRPFFFHFEPGLPRQVAPLAAAMVLALLAWLLTYVTAAATRLEAAFRPHLTAFALLGVGFVLIQIVALHEVQLFLGHPTLNLSVVLGSLLIAGGVGSHLTNRVAAGNEARVVRTVAMATAVVFASWAALWPFAAEALRGAELNLRALVAVIGLAPLGCALGMPFPLVLRSAGLQGPLQVATGWAVNGVMSVVGAVAALLLALQLGFFAVAMVGVLAYLLLAFLGLGRQRR